MTTPAIVWAPQPGPQTDLITCPVFEVCYGGARGGGKTEGAIGDWLEHWGTYKGAANGIFFRRTSKQLEEVVARTKQIYPLLGAKFREQKGEWEFPDGARQKFRYLERDSDAEEYQGHSYTWAGIEEATNFPSPTPIDKIRATLRSAGGVKPRLILTCNPGGPGHSWVKQRYIAPRPTGYKVLRESFKNPFDGSIAELERVFIPSKLSDNMLLMQNDPLYVARLQQQGSAALVKAWLEGDWDIVLGAFFDCFSSALHVLPIEWIAKIPSDALRFRSFDWGSAKPFCVGWYALSDGSWGLPRGALLKYSEWYGTNGQPNVGLKLDAEDVALGIMERERAAGDWGFTGSRMRYGVADPAAFRRDGGPSICERMGRKKVTFYPGDNRRIAGWDQLRRYLVGDAGVPLLYFTENCEDTIRTLPALPHDENDPEDIDTHSEDHAGDETRYAVMSRPHLKKDVTKDLGGDKPPPGTFGHMVQEHFKRMKRLRTQGLRI